MPEGMRRSTVFCPLMTSVCPALWPPWNRTTPPTRSVSRSTILPLPSSPHWAPMTTTFLFIGLQSHPRQQREADQDRDEPARAQRRIAEARNAHERTFHRLWIHERQHALEDEVEGHGGTQIRPQHAHA